MTTLYRYISIVLLPVLAVSCSTPSTGPSTTSGASPSITPEASPSVTAESGSSGVSPTSTVSAETGSTFPIESVSTWTFETSPNPAFSPFHFTMDSEGNLYLISQSSGNTPPDFFKFDSTGQFLSQVGSYGEGEGQFGAPNGLAVDAQGNVYITDAYNVPIQKYDPSGKYIAGWAAHGTNDGEFALASGIAIDREGNLFVVDADARPSDRIQKFDSNGQFITMWDAHAEGDRATSFDMTVDSQGNIYLYIPGKNYRIIKFDPNGQVLTEFDQPVCGSTPIQTSFGGIWVDAQDQIYITDSGGSRICVFDANGAFIGSWEGTGSYSSPIDIVGDNAGNIYVLESNRVEHFQIK